MLINACGSLNCHDLCYVNHFHRNKINKIYIALKNMIRINFIMNNVKI